MAAVMVGPWWAFVVRGVAAVLFGILTFIMPSMALLTLVYLFGAYALVEGAFNIAAALRRSEPRRQSPWVEALEGVVSVVAGLAAFLMPGLTALTLLLLIAAWSIVTGILELAAAIRLRREIEGEWLLVVSGILSVAFGVLLIAIPSAGALAVVLWIGAYALLFGGLLIALGVKLRSWGRAGRPRTGFGELAHGASH
ncbi:HdeD family acid-resistance protein [Anaeromyxobacter oryzisoli]|uniref:HdeD family acid-resistance protein n=1 Tax=Anaeromyxobacter oryzisoli TaxID=2925408 RepID=UPI001F5A5A5C|nr:HdeD family acid-resistance protein [Anaeromyxobacter sp. SG63]